MFERSFFTKERISLEFRHNLQDFSLFLCSLGSLISGLDFVEKFHQLARAGDPLIEREALFSSYNFIVESVAFFIMAFGLVNIGTLGLSFLIDTSHQDHVLITVDATISVGISCLELRGHFSDFGLVVAWIVLILCYFCLAYS